MLGNTLTVTLDGSGGTVKSLVLINQDGYSSEYFLDDGSVTYRAKVRHSHDKVAAGTQKFDRHVITFERFLKPTTTYPNGSLCQTTFTWRIDPDANLTTDQIDMWEAMSFYTVKAGGIAAKMINWES